MSPDFQGAQFRGSANGLEDRAEKIHDRPMRKRVATRHQSQIEGWNVFEEFRGSDANRMPAPAVTALSMSRRVARSLVPKARVTRANVVSNFSGNCSGEIM